MSAEAAPQEPGSAPFADASPARIRRALAAEDASTFDRQWRAAMESATESLDLTEVHDVLNTWRLIAWVTSSHGPRVYRETLDGAVQRLGNGDRADGAIPWSQLQAELGLPG